MNIQDPSLQPGDIIAIRGTVLVEAADADEPPVGSYVEVHSSQYSSQSGQGVQEITVWRRDPDDGWVIANREEVGGYPWREIKANSASWRLLHSGDED